MALYRFIALQHILTAHSYIVNLMYNTFIYTACLLFDEKSLKWYTVEYSDAKVTFYFGDHTGNLKSYNLNLRLHFESVFFLSKKNLVARIFNFANVDKTLQVKYYILFDYTIKYEIY